MSLKPGTTVGEYRVVKLLAQGGMGEVYLAVHGTLGQQVVLKGLHKDLLKQTELHGRLAREAEAMARLSHPNIVAIYNFIDQPDGAYIVMEYVDGATFEDLVTRNGPIPPLDSIGLMQQVLRGVEYAHHQGVIHRDIKPTNLMINSEGQVRILDFGTVKLVDKPGMTRAGTTLGTASYMPIEQLMGKELTNTADIYAIGVTLYELTTGRLPFEAEEAMALVRKIFKEPPVPPSVYCPGMPKKFEETILRCLAKAPADRFQSARDLSDALEAVADTLRPAGAKEAAAVAGPGGLSTSGAFRLAAAASSQAAATAARAFKRRLPAVLAAMGGSGMGFVGVIAGGVLLYLDHKIPGMAVAGFGVLNWIVSTSILGAMAVGVLQGEVRPSMPTQAMAWGLGGGRITSGSMAAPRPTAARITAWRFTPLDPAAVAAVAGKLEGRREASVRTAAARSEEPK